MNKTTSNPYIAQILAKGRDYVPTPAPEHEYPRTIHGRTFETKAEYDEAIADFLNGMWHLDKWHRGRHSPPPDPLQLTSQPQTTHDRDLDR